MKSVKASLLLLLSSFPILTGRAAESIRGENESPSVAPLSDDAVDLRPLNLPSDNRFAAHRSHSSHASHRSGSGGSPTPRPSEPTPGSTAPGVPGRGLVGPGTSNPTDPGRAAPVSPAPAPPKASALTTTEKLKLQIMRVQIALTTLGLFTGEVNGELDSSTQQAIKRFQIIKSLEANGLMTTETLNALGVPAVK